jgi:hypothetical protein
MRCAVGSAWGFVAATLAGKHVERLSAALLVPHQSHGQRQWCDSVHADE